MSASFWVGLFFAWLRLCQYQAACAQSEVIVHVNSPTITKKSLVAVLTFNDLIQEIHINYPGALPQLCFYAFKYLPNLTDKSVFSIITLMVRVTIF